jgi:drug/metabolite transporter (DMT)-like permease
VRSTPLVAAFVLLAFAANSVLCRLALHDTRIDPASFTGIRLLSGAATLWLLVRFGRRGQRLGGDWASAAALLIYAVAFSFAYVAVTTGTGALLLFGAVQLIMISMGLVAGERIDWKIGCGWLVAVSGLVLLLLPGVSAPPIDKAAMMLCAGIAWGVYSLRGRRSNDPLRDTAGNFVRSAPLGVLIVALLWSHASIDRNGTLLALLSGSIASGLGYAAWYTVLPRLSAIVAANLQLSVPVIAALGGVLFTGEAISLRLAISSLLVLGGIALVTWQSQRIKGGR